MSDCLKKLPTELIKFYCERMAAWLLMGTSLLYSMGLYLSKMVESVDEEHNITDDGLPGTNSDKASASPKSDVNEFSIKTSRDDFILRVEDKPLYVNRTLLCCFSSVFKDMLNGELKDKYTDEVALTGKKYGEVLEFLQCLYPNIMKPVTIENVYAVLPLAHEYHVTMLKNACEPCLLRHLSRKKVPDDLYETLEKACFYKLNEVKEKCIDIISERSHEEYEEAESRFTFSDDVGNKIRKKILQNLKVKYKDVYGHMQTSRALYRFLGSASKQKVLLNRYLDGKVVGDYAQLVVKYDFDSSAKLCVDGVPFNIRLYMQQYPYQSNAVFSCKHPGKYSLSCLCAVVIHNHVQETEDLLYIEEKQFTSRVSKFEMRLSKLTPHLFHDAESGFCSNGQIELQLYLFKY